MSDKLEISAFEMHQIAESKTNENEKLIQKESSEIGKDNELNKILQRYKELVDSSVSVTSLYDKQYLLCELEKVANEILKFTKRERREVPENFVLKEVQKPLINITRDGNIFKLDLDENLPHEPRFNKSTGQWRYEYDTQAYYSWCRESTVKYFKENEPFVFKEKCAVLFISYYDDNTVSMDHDNIAVKYLIDGALRPFLCGDGPYELSHLYEGFSDRYNHTEVYLGPVKDIYELAIEINKKNNPLFSPF